MGEETFPMDFRQSFQMAFDLLDGESKSLSEPFLDEKLKENPPSQLFGGDFQLVDTLTV